MAALDPTMAIVSHKEVFHPLSNSDPFYLTHWGSDMIAASLQMAISNASPVERIGVFSF